MFMADRHSNDSQTGAAGAAGAREQRHAKGPPRRHTRLRRVPGSRFGREPATRRGVVAAGAGLAGATLAACLPGQAQTSSAPAIGKKPVTLNVFITSISGDLATQFQANLIAPYTANHPNVTVNDVTQEPGFATMGGTAGTIEKLVAYMAAGTPPNLFEGPREAAWLASQSLIESQDGLIKRDKVDLKRFNQKHLERSAQYQGKTWLLPHGYGGNALVQLLNVELFKQAGVPIPGPDAKSSWTWDQWLDALVKLTKKGPDGTIGQFGLANYGWDWGSWPLLWETDWITPDLKTIVCDSQPMQECFTRFFELPFRHHVLPQRGEASRLFGNANLFNTGKAAITILPPYAFRTYALTKFFEFTIAPMPRVKLSTPDMNLHMVSIVKGSQDQEEAWSFVKYLTDGSRLGRYVWRIPAEVAQIQGWLKDVLKDYADPRPQVVVSAVENAVPQIQIGRHPKTQDITAVVEPAFVEIWEQKVQPVDQLRVLKPRLQNIIDMKS